MNQPRTLISLLLLFFISYVSCKKSDSPNLNKIYIPEYVSATISGRVTDDAGKPVSGALVKAGEASANTDIDGVFTISNVTIDKKAAFIKVEKNGFFLGTKTLVAVANKNNQVAIRLIPKTLAGTITGSGGGTVTVPSNGGAITFEANSIVNPAINTPYTGTVTVHAFFINPEASDFNDIMPGTLRGIDAANQETGLQSFGMMAVELSGTAGEKLQLASGKNATLRFPIPASLQAEAPATIPLWSLDETIGLWKQEGSATRQGTEYIGNVSHFSFWNCDAPFPVVDFTGIIRNQQGISMAGVEVTISVPPAGNTAGSISASGITSAEGVVSGKLPANKTLQLKIYDKCHTLLHIQSIGPFSTTADLGVITVDYSSSQVTFSGSVKNCFNEPVTNGFVTVRIENNYFNIPVTDGSFTTTITRCSNSATTATLIPFDAIKQETGTEVNIPVSGNTVNAGTLVACGTTSDTYLRYTLDGVSYQILPPADTLRFFYQQTANREVSSIEATRQGEQLDMAFFFTGPQTPGIHPIAIIEVLHGGPNTLYYHNGDINVDITEYGNAPGGYVSGTFSGTARNPQGTQIVPISCSFRVKRQ
jgi:hypothetical protein